MADRGKELRNLAQRVRDDEVAEFALMLPPGGADPNGVVSAAESTFYWDATNNKLYVNDDGATSWSVMN